MEHYQRKGKKMGGPGGYGNTKYQELVRGGECSDRKGKTLNCCSNLIKAEMQIHFLKKTFQLAKVLLQDILVKLHLISLETLA